MTDHPNSNLRPLRTPSILQRPASLSLGSRVGVAALSGPVDDERLQAGLQRLRSWGFEAVLAPNLGSRQGFLAGSDDERLDGFHGLLREGVDAVVFARGGHGVLRILDRLDWDLVGSVPRWFVGYSDLTPFLLEVSRRFRWQTLHGPMVATDLDRDFVGEEERAFLGCLRGESWPSAPLHAVRGADGDVAIEGPVIAGCLSMVCSVLGTPFSGADLFNEAVVLLEDVGEPAYKIDRMLSQLRLAGLDRARGLIFGHCHARHEDVGENCSDSDGAEAADEVLEVLADHGERMDMPIWSGLGFGHGTPNLAIPVGAKGTIRSNRLNIHLGLPSSRAGS